MLTHLTHLTLLGMARHMLCHAVPTNKRRCFAQCLRGSRALERSFLDAGTKLGSVLDIVDCQARWRPIKSARIFSLLRIRDSGAPVQR